MRKLLRRYPILGYYFNKLFTYFITIYGALTISFFMFRLIPTNPIQNWVKSLERQYSVKVEGGDAMISRYKEEFGLTGVVTGFDLERAAVVTFHQVLNFLEVVFRNTADNNLAFFPGYRLEWNLLVVPQQLANILGSLLQLCQNDFICLNLSKAAAER